MKLELTLEVPGDEGGNKSERSGPDECQGCKAGDDFCHATEDGYCGEGYECCNGSCGICVVPGDYCIALACPTCDEIECGCENPICTCNDERCGCTGESVCGGTQFSGSVCSGCKAGQVGCHQSVDGYCGEDYECCNDSCGTCVKPGGSCSEEGCYPELEECSGCKAGQVGCHQSVDGYCGEDYECCNDSCGTCVKPGGSCTEEGCHPEPEECSGCKAGDEGCDADKDGYCMTGLECCNDSCGKCVEKGMFCTEEHCATGTGEGGNSTSQADFCSGCRVGMKGCDADTNEYCAEGLKCCNDSCGACIEPGSGFGCNKMLCRPCDPSYGKCVDSVEGVCKDVHSCLVDPCDFPDACNEGETCTSNFCGGCNKVCTQDATKTGEEKTGAECSGCKAGDEGCDKDKGGYCMEGLDCCNDSCGMCLEKGMFCSQQYCPPEKEKSEAVIFDLGGRNI